MIMTLDVDVTAERRHYNTHRPTGQSTTLGLKGRRPLSKANTTLLHNLRRQPRPFFIICGVSRHHHPLNPLNPLNLLNPGRSAAPNKKIINVYSIFPLNVIQ